MGLLNASHRASSTGVLLSLSDPQNMLRVFKVILDLAFYRIIPEYQLRILPTSQLSKIWEYSLTTRPKSTCKQTVKGKKSALQVSRM